MAKPTYPRDIPALPDATATAPAITVGQLITHEESIAAKKDEKHFIATPSYARAKARRLTIDNASIQATDETGAAVPPWFTPAFTQAFNHAMVPFVQQILASNKNVMIRQQNNNSQEAYYTLFREAIPTGNPVGGAVNHRPLYLFEGETNDHVFPRSRSAVNRMTGVQVMAFSDWYGITGTEVPAGGNLQTRRAAVIAYICGV